METDEGDSRSDLIVDGGTEYEALLELSARNGANPLRTQGAGGNTSLKIDGVLWIKASGMWLARAETQPIMVPVALAALLAAYRSQNPEVETAETFVQRHLSNFGLRPSIETTVHAVIDQTVVLHLHCVETIAHAVRTDAQRRLSARLDGLPGVRWCLVPYRRPGLPLARAIEEVTRGISLNGDNVNVHVLANHGLIVSGASVTEADERLEAVVTALAVQPRSPPAANLPKLQTLATGSFYDLPVDPVSHAVGTDPIAAAIAAGGPLYPDHVIFLSDRIDVLPPGESAAAYQARVSDPTPLLIVPGAGVLLRRDAASPGAQAMARCLAEVTLRIEQGAPVRHLGGDDVYALTHWEAEAYRQGVDEANIHAG
jgi:rhamnose utilization protein RhaD (predicted bifunctional aldolase and dehydrogenase)